MHLYFGHGAPDMFGLPQPELAGIRLGLGVRRPVVADMLVLTGYLAAVAAVADSNVDYENLH
jgi:hypothetical protein